MVPPTPLCKGRPRLLKSEQYILVYGVPKWRLKPIFPPLLIEIPSSDSLVARTDINTQDREESAVGVISAVSACHCETELEQHRLPLQATRTTAAAARHSPRGRRCFSGRWAPQEREAGAIRLQELAAELLA